MIQKYINTGNIDIDLHKEWLDIIDNSKNRWANILRVHVVDFPISNYLKYELEVYKYNQQKWEEIFLISRNDFEWLKLDVNTDFWLFDDSFILNIIYTDLWEYIKSEYMSENVSKYIKVKNKLLSVAKHLDL